MEYKDEMIFADGMGFKEVPPNAPEAVRGNVYFNVEKFKAFLDKYKDSRGWVNTKMMKSKEKGTIYFILDTWKPQAQPTLADVAEAKEKRDFAPNVNEDLSDIPF